jgi:hypothetical protein
VSEQQVLLFQGEVGCQSLRELFCGREMQWKHQGWEKAANNEKCGDEGEWPTFPWESIRHVVNVFRERAEEKSLEDTDDMNGV